MEQTTRRTVGPVVVDATGSLRSDRVVGVHLLERRHLTPPPTPQCARNCTTAPYDPGVEQSLKGGAGSGRGAVVWFSRLSARDVQAATRGRDQLPGDPRRRTPRRTRRYPRCREPTV